MMKICDNCLKKVECEYNEKETTIEINNKKIKYLKKYYICDECGNEFLDDLYDYDVETVNNELRKINNIITKEEIEEILKKYNIGKKPFSIVLGLGEINVIRYLKGSNPTKEISDLLKNILNNPFLYELYLMGNKDKISEIAYKKSLGKTKQMELINDKSKMYNVALYTINKLGEIDPLSLQKILFFINGFSKVFLGNHLFNDLPEAWVHGPVYKEIYESFSYYHGDKIEYDELLKEREYEISNKERKYLDTIIEDFGSYSGSILREMTHLTVPWINTRKGLEPNEASNRKIEFNEVDDYFLNIYNEYNMKDIKDISKYSEKLFRQAKKLRFK